MARALLIVAKAPEPGRTKTRLVPPLSHDQAARLYESFLLDTLHLAGELAWERTTIVAPSGASIALSRLLPTTVSVLEQHGVGLGDALRQAFAAHFAEQFSRVVLVGSDSPTLPSEFVDQAADALLTHDVAIGPTLDGGYYLIGMRAPYLGLFDDIHWSTASVFDETLDRARALQLRVSVLPTWYDVDDAAHLLRLETELRTAPEHIAPRTRATLRTLRLVVSAA